MQPFLGPARIRSSANTSALRAGFRQFFGGAEVAEDRPLRIVVISCS
jgi:hypothetical protein